MAAVCIITPTGRREALLRLQYQNLLAQTVQDFEWRILDDGPAPSDFFATLKDGRVHYEYSAQRISIGAKRNRMIEGAGSDLIVQFDDDDFYVPAYLETMIARLEQADIAKLSAFYLYSAPRRGFFYWDLTAPGGMHYQVSVRGIEASEIPPAEVEEMKKIQFGFGFAMAFRKTIWRQTPFQDRFHDEDGAFVTAARQAGARLDLFADTKGLCLHILRKDNSAFCFPQYRLPQFLMAQMFGPNAVAMTQS
jgi:glycosyltransferase involved in cell wall biosynthesis